MGLDLIKTDSQEREPSLEETKLADGSPIINVFLPNTPVLSHEQHEAASDALRNAIANDPTLVASCNGKSVTEAAEILKKYIDEMDSSDQMAQAA
jgi:hypothetical protein